MFLDSMFLGFRPVIFYPKPYGRQLKIRLVLAFRSRAFVELSDDNYNTAYGYLFG